MKNFTFIDLFAGIGGFHIPLKNNGGKCIGFSEIDTYAITAYTENLGIANNFGDITKIANLQHCDILAAGVPCQSWSIAGRNLGFDDERGQLWNDTIYLLKKAQPKVFIFENVKGLVDPRNEKSFEYILQMIKDSGYFAKYYLINSSDYGTRQNRIRVYIIGFRKDAHAQKFQISHPLANDYNYPQNDYYSFNDLRAGNNTIHSWDILDTTKREKDICLLLLKNRRKKLYGNLDGNPLSLYHFQEMDNSITQKEIDNLIKLEILKPIEYTYMIDRTKCTSLTEDENIILSHCVNETLCVADLKNNRVIKKAKISVLKVIELLKAKEILIPIEIRYDFKNTKISTGLFGVNRIFLPNAKTFHTLVSSDTMDYIVDENISCNNKREFIEKIYKPKKFRKITKEEACELQGFPTDYKLPENRRHWMKLIGNSVSIPVIDMLIKNIIKTGVFDD